MRASLAIGAADSELRPIDVESDPRAVSPVDGYVTNLLAQLGDYVDVGVNTISVVDANSFWVDGYFEERNLAPIHLEDPAKINLMGYSQIVRGNVDSIALERTAQQLGGGHGQPDLHVGTPCPAHPSPHPYR
jgi:multidrug resistance efflux pump